MLNIIVSRVLLSAESYCHVYVNVSRELLSAQCYTLLNVSLS